MNLNQIGRLPALIKIETVCAIAGVSNATVRRLIKDGKLPVPYHGQFYRKADVLRALGMAPPDPPNDTTPAPSPWASGLEEMDKPTDAHAIPGRFTYMNALGKVVNGRKSTRRKKRYAVFADDGTGNLVRKGTVHRYPDQAND